MAIAVCLATSCVPVVTGLTGCKPPLTLTDATSQSVLERARARRAAWAEPKDLAEAVQRLAEVRARIGKTGKVKLRYSEAELRALVSNSPVPQERYLVRLVAYEPQDGDYLGRMRSFGKQTLWAATFEQLEEADTAPEILTRLLGMNYVPQNSYYLLILRDLGADMANRPEMVCPTWEKILELAKRDLSNEFFKNEDFDEAVNGGYGETYRSLMARFYELGYKEYIQADVDKYVDSVESLKSDEHAQRLFRTRLRVHAQYGANELFRGDGLTLFVGDQPRKAGVQEIFLLDPAPKPIGEYAQQGQLRKIKCEPLVKEQPLSFEEWDASSHG